MIDVEHPCPWCGEECMSDPWELSIIADGDTVDGECEACGQPVSVTCKMSVEYEFEQSVKVID